MATMTYPGLPDLSGSVMENIKRLLAPTPQSLAESDTNAAQASLASGVPAASQFGANRQLVLRDSEQRARTQQGAQLLEPYLTRDSSERIAANAQAGEDRRLAVSGQQAMERLQLSEAGQTQRLSMSEKAALERAMLEGQQAMERLQVSEGGQNTRQQQSIEAQYGLQSNDLASRENLQNNQISAEAARQALSEAGLDRRLSSNQQAEMAQAVLRGDQQRQLQIMQEAGLDSRQAAQIAAQLNLADKNNANQLAAIDRTGANQARNTILQHYLTPEPARAGVGGAAAGGRLPAGVYIENNLSPVDSRGNATEPVRYRNADGSLYTGQEQSTPRGGGLSKFDLDALLANYGIKPSFNLLGAYP
jgi:hypothetical protein